MFCGKCGNQISENEKFCSNCGAMVVPEQTQANSQAPVLDQAALVQAPAVNQVPTKKSKKKTWILVSSIAAVVVAAAVVVLLFMNNGANGKGYIKEVEAYLNYIAEKDDSVSGYFDDAYLGGGFGELYSGDEAAELAKECRRAMFEDWHSEDMGYDYGYFDSDYDDWKDYTQVEFIDDFYDAMESTYGDWDLRYDIVEAKELSASKTDKLYDIWEGIIEMYEEVGDILTDKEDREKVEEFVESIEDLEITKAYEVEVEIEIDGDERSYEDDVEFIVAKIGKEWVILEGPSFYEFTNP